MSKNKRVKPFERNSVLAERYELNMINHAAEIRQLKAKNQTLQMIGCDAELWRLRAECNLRLYREHQLRAQELAFAFRRHRAISRILYALCFLAGVSLSLLVIQPWC